VEKTLFGNTLKINNKFNFNNMGLIDVSGKKLIIKEEENQFEATEEQKSAINVIQDFFSSKYSEMVLIGAAGTGKTFVTKYIIKSLPKTLILGATLSHSAKEILIKNLDNDQIKCFSITSALGKKPEETPKNSKVNFIYNHRKRAPIKDAYFILIDEASMVDSKIKYEIDRLRPSGSKVLYIGDDCQLPPVESKEDSPVFNLKIKAELTKTIRFSGPILKVANYYREIIKYIKQVGDDSFNKETMLYNFMPKVKENGTSVYFTRNASEILKYANEYFLKEPYETRILAYQNQTIDNINSSMRSLFYNDEEYVSIGEQIIMNAPYNKTKNGSINRIENIYNSFKTLNLNFGKKLTNNSRQNEWWMKNKLHFKTYKLYLSNGDRIEILHESELERFQRLREKIKKEAKNSPTYWEQFKILNTAFANISRTYATTTHKAQGRSINNIFVYANEILSIEKTSNKIKMQSLYVSISRAKKNLFVLF